MAELLTQNSKLKKTSVANGIKVMNFGIPAQSTCLWADKCKKYCYASKGAYIWSNVKPAFEAREKITRHARIFKTEQELIAEGYANASDNDLIAIGNNPKIGLLSH
jgi:hypothetical protein